VSRPSGRIKYYEIWNEPTAFWGGPITDGDKGPGITLAHIAQSAFQDIKSIDPNAMVLTPSYAEDAAGLDHYLSAVQTLSRGASVYADIIAFHGYNLCNPASIQCNPPENVQDVINQTQGKVALHGLSSMPLWDTEASWGPNATPTDQDLNDDQPGFVARSYTLQASLGIDRFIWYGWDYAHAGDYVEALSLSPPSSRAKPRPHRDE